jgi:tetratricopeptide (TPR) repeat protein
MVLDWFGRAKEASVDQLMARKNYGKAIEKLKVELDKRRKDPRLKLRLAEALVAAGRGKEAIPILEPLADEYALEGFAARAITILKRIQTIDPERVEIEEKLSYLISQQDSPAPDPWRSRAASSGPGFEIGMEEVDGDGELGMEAMEDGPPPPVHLALGVTAEAVEEDDSFREELAALIEGVFSAPENGGPKALSSPTGFVRTPLFASLSPDELLAVIRGLRLVTLEPGEIVVTQGEPGGSLFILTTGLARAYVKDKSGRSIQVRQLAEGDFFGEVSILQGGARSATVTARTRCELLELDRATLDDIAGSHPHVSEVLQKFYAERASRTVEAAISKRLGA